MNVTLAIPNPHVISVTPLRGCAPTYTTFTATASDPESGISSVYLYFTNLATGQVQSKSMTSTGGGTYSVTVDAIEDSIAIGDYSPTYVKATNGEKLSSQSSNVRWSVVKCT